MKKLIAILLLVLPCLPTGLAESALTPGRAMMDFSAPTTDGEEIALSELLGEKDLVVLNIFATWCPPCEREFPMIDEIYQKYSDRMEIVALSGYEGDSMDAIADYKAGHGLSFPMGSATGTGLMDFLQVEAYPTTVFIDRGGNMNCAVVGSFPFPEAFESVVTYFLKEDYDGAPAALYGVYAFDQNDELVPGVTVNFCTDTVCQPAVTNENGVICFTGPLDNYHLQVLQVPEGYTFDESFDAYVSEESGWVGIPVTRN
ncbi:MAG: redoxin domain-containing protein [Clostridia bacterium]|nr:redoxin domain-containing protein [Clostridia bacterium]